MIPPGIPSAVLANNNHLSFTVTADSAGTETARAAIIIALPDGIIDSHIFQIYYWKICHKLTLILKTCFINVSNYIVLFD